MQIKILVKRQASQHEKSYTQEFTYNGDGKLTVADWLNEINRTKAADNRIAWECGCLEKKCGACAMLINGIPVLACSVFLKDIKKHGKITIEPFRKFPLVKDLIVDKTVMFEALKNMKIWLSDKNSSDFSWDHKLQYKAGQCLLCGCCLEICPNFMADGEFAGAAAIIGAYRDMEQNAKDRHYHEMKFRYKEMFYQHCGQALSCKSVCPQHLPIDEIQARMNTFID